MKIIPKNYVKIFLVAGLIYLLLLVCVMSIFSVRDANGFFSDLAFILFGIVYQIPLSIINSLFYAYKSKKDLNMKVPLSKMLQLNIPFLWFPLSVVQYFGIYWIKKGDLYKTEDGQWFDKNSPLD